MKVPFSLVPISAYVGYHMNTRGNLDTRARKLVWQIERDADQCASKVKKFVLDFLDK